MGKRSDLLGQLIGGQAHLQAGRPDGAGHVRSHAHRFQRPPHDDVVDGGEQHQDRQDQPGDPLQEHRDDVVDHHVGVLEVLSHLHPGDVAAAMRRKAAAVVDRGAVAAFVEGRMVRIRAGRKQGAAAGERGEKHPPLGVQDRVGEARGSLGVLSLQRRRKLQPPACGRALQVVLDGVFVPSESLVLEVGGGGVQEQAHRHRQDDRQHGHRQQVEPDDPPEQRIDRRPHLSRLRRRPADSPGPGPCGSPPWRP